MKTILIVAPHPDDELLGCGGTALRAIRKMGADCHWLIVTDMLKINGFKEERVVERQDEIGQVAKIIGFTSVSNLQLPPARLDTLPMAELISKIGGVLTKIRPDTVFVPYRGDAHTDHRQVFDAAAACCKSFRAPWVKYLFAYETISETDFGLDPDSRGFKANVWIDITDFLDEKVKLLNIYRTEMGNFPFPRSDVAVEALARMRGAQMGVRAAEAFMLLKASI